MCRPPSTSISVGAEPSALPSATCLFRSAVTSADRALKPLPARMARAGGTRNRPRWLSTNHRAEHRMRDTRLSAQYSAARYIAARYSAARYMYSVVQRMCAMMIDVRHAACGVRYDVETPQGRRERVLVLTGGSGVVFERVWGPRLILEKTETPHLAFWPRVHTGS
jgi:hypothetical protein